MISSSVVDNLFPVVRGKIQLKPFFGDSITADLVCLICLYLIKMLLMFGVL